MIEKQRTNQGGSVGSFVIVGIILVLGLIGAVYGLNIRGDQARKDQTTAANDNQSADNKSTSSDQIAKSDSAQIDNSDATTSATDSSVSQDLPATGMELSVGELTGVFALVTVIMAYTLSCKKLLRNKSF